MRNIIIGLGMLMVTSYAMAGGNMTSNVSKVAEIGTPCKADKVYVDRHTDLMWQDAPYTDAEDGAYARERSVGKAGILPHAIDYCRGLNYAGYTDWRLPTASELMGVHHYQGEDFIYSRDKDFWTSTPTTEGKYYVVYPADAYKYKRSKRQSNYIRCVRCVKK